MIVVFSAAVNICTSILVHNNEKKDEKKKENSWRWDGKIESMIMSRKIYTLWPVTVEKKEELNYTQHW